MTITAPTSWLDDLSGVLPAGQIITVAVVGPQVDTAVRLIRDRLPLASVWRHDDQLRGAGRISDGSMDVVVLAGVRQGQTDQQTWQALVNWCPKVKRAGYLAGYGQQSEIVRRYARILNLAVIDDERGYWRMRKPDLPDSVSDYVTRLETGPHYCQANYGDGEWQCILGYQGENCNGERYGPDLAKALRRTMERPITGMLYGQNPGWRLAGEVAAWMDVRGYDVPCVRKDVLSEANCQGRLGPWLRALRSRSIALVGPPHLRRVPHYVLAPETFIEVPPADAFRVVDRTVDAARKAVDTGVDTVLFASGMATNVAVWRLWPNLAHRCILHDVGAIFDPYAGVLSRSGYRKPQFQAALKRNIEEAGG